MAESKLKRVVDYLNLQAKVNPYRFEHMQELETKLGLKLPPGFVEWFAREDQGYPLPWHESGGGVHMGWGQTGQQTYPDEIMTYGSKRFLPLYSESDGVFTTALALDEGSDPPLYTLDPWAHEIGDEAQTPEPPEWHAANFEDFLCAALATSFIFSPFYRAEERTRIAGEDIERHRAELRALGGVQVHTRKYFYQITTDDTFFSIRPDGISVLALWQFGDTPGPEGVRYDLNFQVGRPAGPVPLELAAAITSVTYGQMKPETFEERFGQDWLPNSDYWSMEFNKRRNLIRPESPSAANILEVDMVETVLMHPHLYTPNGTFYEAVAFIEGYIHHAIHHQSTERQVEPWQDFLHWLSQWLGKKPTSEQENPEPMLQPTEKDVMIWFRNTYQDEAEAFFNLVLVYHKFLELRRERQTSE